MVAQFGSEEVCRHFIRQYETHLGLMARWLLELYSEQQEKVFHDAICIREGGFPRTTAGLRLAAPRWFLRRVADPIRLWEESAPPLALPA